MSVIYFHVSSEASLLCVKTTRFSVICASKSLLTLLLPSGLSLIDLIFLKCGPNRSQCFRGDNSTDAEWKLKFFSCILYSLSCIAMLDMCWIGFLFVSFQLLDSLKYIKLFSKIKSHKPISNAVLPHGLQTFYFKPLEGLQLWKVLVPHICVWQSMGNGFETFHIFANCLRDSLVLGLG